MIRVSENLKKAVKRDDRPDYEIARLAGMGQAKLSQFINNMVVVHEKDPRVIAIGNIVGVNPEDCFA